MTRTKGMATLHVIGAGRRKKRGALEGGSAVGARNRNVQVAISRIGYGTVRTRNKQMASRNVMSAWEKIMRRQ